MKTGIYDSLSNDDYHGGEGISKSGLDIINRSAAHFKAAQDAREAGLVRPEKTHFKIGRAFHALVLEPHLFVSDYCLSVRKSDYPHAIDNRDTLVALVEQLNAGREEKLPVSGSKSEIIDRILSVQTAMDINLISREDLEPLKGADLTAMVRTLNESRKGLLRTNGTIDELCAILALEGNPVTLWSHIRDEWLSNNGHRTVLDIDQWETVHRMRDSVMAHPAASVLVAKKGIAERSVYWHDKVTGELCRCRPDYWTDDNYLVDLKSTEDADPEEFSRSVAKWRYHVQDPFYRDGVFQATKKKVKNFIFIVTEKTAPFVTAVYVLRPEDIELGRMEYRANLDTYAESKKTGKWRAYSDKIEQLALPAYYVNRTLNKVL